tara:strand:- start:1512 stop:2816 length:1305 start_codon:yes stop_codon:yes gene_type:complete
LNFNLIFKFYSPKKNILFIFSNLIIIILLISCSNEKNDQFYDHTNLPNNLSNSIIYKTLNNDVNIYTDSNHHSILISDTNTKYYWPTITDDNEYIAYSYVSELSTEYQIGIDLLDIDKNTKSEIYSTKSSTKNLLSNNIPHYMTWAPNSNILSFATPTENYPALYIYKHTNTNYEKLIDFGPLWINWNADKLSVHRRDKRFVYEINDSISNLVDTTNVSMYYRIDPWINSDELLSIFQDFNIVTIVKSNISTEISEILFNVNQYSMLNISPNKKYLSILSSDTYPTSVYDSLALYDLESNQIVFQTMDSPIGYFWSPDSSKVLIISTTNEPSNYNVNLLNVNNYEITKVQTMQFTSEQLEMFIFADQFANSHKLWSHDSSEILIAGSIEFSNIESEDQIVTPKYNIFKISDLDTKPVMKKLFPGLIGYWTNLQK